MSVATSSRQWLTPEDAPTSRKCRRVFIPEGMEYEAAFRGAMLLLADPDNWEKFGSQEPEDVAREFMECYFLSQDMDAC